MVKMLMGSLPCEDKKGIELSEVGPKPAATLDSRLRQLLGLAAADEIKDEKSETDRSKYDRRKKRDQ